MKISSFYLAVVQLVRFGEMLKVEISNRRLCKRSCRPKNLYCDFDLIFHSISDTFSVGTVHGPYFLNGGLFFSAVRFYTCKCAIKMSLVRMKKKCKELYSVI